MVIPIIFLGFLLNIFLNYPFIHLGRERQCGVKFIVYSKMARFRLELLSFRLKVLYTNYLTISTAPPQDVHVELYSLFLNLVFFANLEHTARQAQANGGPRPPKRPDYGTVGRPIKLRANFFRLNISPQLTDLYHYDVEITPNKCPKTVKRDVVKEIIRKYKDTTFKGHSPAFDGEKNLYSSIELPAPVSLNTVCSDFLRNTTH